MTPTKAKHAPQIPPRYFTVAKRIMQNACPRSLRPENWKMQMPGWIYGCARHLHFMQFVRERSLQMKHKRNKDQTQRRTDFKKKLGKLNGVSWRNIVLHDTLQNYRLASIGKLMHIGNGYSAAMYVIKNKIGRNTIKYYSI